MTGCTFSVILLTLAMTVLVKSAGVGGFLEHNQFLGVGGCYKVSRSSSQGHGMSSSQQKLRSLMLKNGTGSNKLCFKITDTTIPTPSEHLLLPFYCQNTAGIFNRGLSDDPGHPGKFVACLYESISCCSAKLPDDVGVPACLILDKHHNVEAPELLTQISKQSKGLVRSQKIRLPVLVL